MATLTAANPRVYKGHLETANLIADTDATWKAGNFLQLSTEGYLQRCADAATQITHYALTDLNTAPGNTTTSVKVGVVHQDIIWLGNEKDGTVAATDIGDAFGLDLTSNVHTLDLATDAQVLQLVGVMSDIEPLRNVAADVSGRLLFRVLEAAINLTPAAAI